MAAVAATPSFSLPLRSYLPPATAAAEWDRLAVAHGLRDRTRDFVKDKFKRIELFAQISDKELDAIPVQADLAGVGQLSEIDITVELAALRMVREQLREQLAAVSAGSAKEEVELDSPLPTSELLSLQEKFKAHHKFFWTPEQAPSDQMVSRSSREFTKRSLSRRQLDKGKSQADSQQAGLTKSASVGGMDVDAKLVFGAAEQAAPLGGQMDTLFRIKLLLRAHAIAGIELIADPEPNPIPPDHDSTQYRVCPFDVVFRIQCRIERCLKDVPQDQAKSWLIRMFDQEQRYWIEAVRDTRMTIGQVMLQSLQQREAVWAQPVQPSVPRPLPERRQEKETAGSSSSAADKPPASFPINFCQAFNKGKCRSGDKCQYKHRCSKKTGTRPDGTPHYCNGNHSAKDHDRFASAGKSPHAPAKTRKAKGWGKRK